MTQRFFARLSRQPEMIFVGRVLLFRLGHLVVSLPVRPRPPYAIGSDYLLDQFSQFEPFARAGKSTRSPQVKGIPPFSLTLVGIFISPLLTL